MYNFFKECVKRYKVINSSTENLPQFFPCISLMVAPGITGIATYGGGRTSDLRAIFTSWAKGNDYVSAYNAIQVLKNKLLLTDYETLLGLGYEIDRVNVESVKDLTYIQDNQKYFRFQWTAKVTYREAV